MVYLSAGISHPTTKSAQCRATSLIGHKMLPLRHATYCYYYFTATDLRLVTLIVDVLVAAILVVVVVSVGIMCILVQSVVV